jgi:hypothetical protein
MRHQANSLDEVYEILRAYKEPVAVIDYISGEMGYEILTAQFFGGNFYDTHKENLRVVALAWMGQCAIFDNVSHDQIELVNVERSMSGNRKHQGSRRLAWLEHSGHSLREIPNVAIYMPPMAPSEKMLIAKYSVNQEQLLRLVVDRLQRTRDVVIPLGDRLVRGDYVAIFDRNDKHQAGRNTKLLQVERLCGIAEEYGLKVVVVSGFNPRDFGPSVVRFTPRHRDLDLLCNIAHHCTFFAGPVSGATTTAAIFGCNLFALGRWWNREPLISALVTSRGFSYLGALHTDHVRRFLDARA